jgi:hypothetical protein
MKTVPKIALAGLGIYLVSSMLKAASKAAPSFAPRSLEGYAPLMTGYDPLAEAIGCVNGSFQSIGDMDGLGFAKKLKKAVKKAVKAPVKAVQKVVKKPVQAVKKVAAQAKRDVKTVTKPLVRDFKKAGAIVQRDFTKAAKIVKSDFTRGAAQVQRDFRGAGAMAQAIGGKKSKPSKQMRSTGGTIYLDENGNEITEAQYNALMAQYEAMYSGYDPNQTTGIMPPDYQYDANYGYDPNEAFGADQYNTPSPTYSMDQVYADWFAQGQEEPGGYGFDDRDVLAYAQGYADQTGFADGTVPYTGDYLWDMPTGYDYDPLAAFYLPQELQDDTFDVYGASMTDGNSFIMPYNEPSTPFSADELWIGYEDPDAWTRGGQWTPEPSGHGYGNPYQGGMELPGYWQNYGGFDWNWDSDGLGDLTIKPGAHKNMSPAVLSMLRSQQKPNTSGYVLRDPNEKPITLKADKNGMVYAKNGGSMHRVGPLAKLAKALGLGCDCFGRDMGVSGLGGFLDFLKKSEKTAKKVASYTTPSGFAAAQFKKRDPKLYKETTKVLGQSKPYVMIAGGTALTVLSVGAASPAGVAMIAGGVASLGAQAYGDIATREAEKDLEKAIERDRINEALYSTDVINQTQHLNPTGGPSAGEIPGGDWPWEYAGDGVWADFLNLVGMNPN